MKVLFTNNRLKVLPGFSLSLGITLTWIGFIIILPIISLFITASAIPIKDMLQILTRPAALASFRITFFYAFVCALLNSFVGLIISWTLVRAPFKGSKILDSLIDLPFALPGSVGGIALATVFGKNGVIGKFFDYFDISLVYNQFGILIGFMFITLPFSVRSIQPLIQELDKDEEQAARMLGASQWQVFLKVQLPYLLPGIFTAFILSFARTIGEYGTIVFIAGNIPLKSEVISRYIYNKIDQYDLPGATLVAATLLILSLVLLSVCNYIQNRWRRKYE